MVLVRILKYITNPFEILHWQQESSPLPRKMHCTRLRKQVKLPCDAVLKPLLNIESSNQTKKQIKSRKNNTFRSSIFHRQLTMVVIHAFSGTTISGRTCWMKSGFVLNFRQNREELIKHFLGSQTEGSKLRG